MSNATASEINKYIDRLNGIIIIRSTVHTHVVNLTRQATAWKRRKRNHSETNSAVEKLLRHCTKRLVFHAAVIISTEWSDAIHTVAHSGKHSQVIGQQMSTDAAPNLLRFVRTTHATTCTTIKIGSFSGHRERSALLEKKLMKAEKSIASTTNNLQSSTEDDGNDKSFYSKYCLCIYLRLF